MKIKTNSSEDDLTDGLNPFSDDFKDFKLRKLEFRLDRKIIVELVTGDEYKIKCRNCDGEKWNCRVAITKGKFSYHFICKNCESNVFFVPDLKEFVYVSN